MKDSKEILDIAKEVLKELRVNFNVNLTGILFIVFLVLKLTGVIEWSWWWVTAPLWCGVALWIVILVLVLLILLITWIISEINN